MKAAGRPETKDGWLGDIGRIWRVRYGRSGLLTRLVTRGKACKQSSASTAALIPLQIEVYKIEKTTTLYTVQI